MLRQCLGGSALPHNKEWLHASRMAVMGFHRVGGRVVNVFHFKGKVNGRLAGFLALNNE